MLEIVLRDIMGREEEVTVVVEEVVVEVEERLSWHQLQHREDYKVLLFMMVNLVRFCLIRVLHTHLYLVVIA